MGLPPELDTLPKWDVGDYDFPRLAPIALSLSHCRHVSPPARTDIHIRTLLRPSAVFDPPVPILGFHTLDFGSTSETTTTKRKTVTARAGHYCTNPSDFAFATAIDFLDFSVSIIPLSGPYGTFLLGLEHLYLLASSSLHRTAVHNRFLVLSHSPPGSSSVLLFFSLILDLFSWSQLPYTGLGG